MTQLILASQQQIAELCRRFHVAEFYVFGSAATGDFQERSDLDFLVSFGDCTPLENADRYFGLLAALQDLFERQIDLVEIEAIRNPYFKRGAESSRVLLYAA